MHITEPMTMLTDYLLGILTLFWALRLFRFNKQEPQPARSLWALGFAATAFASWLGGTFHGFKTHLTDATAEVLWRGTTLSVGIASWTTLSAIILVAAAGGWRGVLLALAAAKFLVYVVWISRHPEFRFVIIDYASAMIGMTILATYLWAGRHARSAPWILSGIGVGFIAAWVQSARCSVHLHFNHNDLFHLIQAAAFYLFFRAGLHLVARGKTVAA
jgi:hypothetical protein